VRVTADATVRLEPDQTTDEQLAFLIEPRINADGHTVLGPPIGLAMPRPPKHERARTAVEREIKSVLEGRASGRCRESMAAELRSLGVQFNAGQLATAQWRVTFESPITDADLTATSVRDDSEPPIQATYRHIRRAT
jgi:hypothetical protein